MNLASKRSTTDMRNSANPQVINNDSSEMLLQESVEEEMAVPGQSYFHFSNENEGNQTKVQSAKDKSPANKRQGQGQSGDKNENNNGGQASGSRPTA
ncbi:hypothetical protein BX616_004666, partial [Lobosporangium transversale]